MLVFGKKILLGLGLLNCGFLFAESPKQHYLTGSYNYNIADIPNYFTYHYYTTYGNGNPYYYYYQNNSSLTVNYLMGKNRLFYRTGLSFERIFLLSDTASFPSTCGITRYTIQEKGNYFCIVNGMEFFPVRTFKFVSLSFDVALGYSPNASRYTTVLEGCSSYSSFGERKLFFNTSLALNGYIPIKDKLEAFFNFRYQPRGTIKDLFTHVNYGFGVGLRYCISAKM